MRGLVHRHLCTWHFVLYCRCIDREMNRQHTLPVLYVCGATDDSYVHKEESQTWYNSILNAVCGRTRNKCCTRNRMQVTETSPQPVMRIREIYIAIGNCKIGLLKWSVLHTCTYVCMYIHTVVCTEVATVAVFGEIKSTQRVIFVILLFFFMTCDRLDLE